VVNRCNLNRLPCTTYADYNPAIRAYTYRPREMLLRPEWAPKVPIGSAAQR
jgi:hypothetical protein